MPRTIRVLAILFALYLVAALSLSRVVPAMLHWHQANCLESATFVCYWLRVVLSYWWIAVVPVLLAATLVLDRAMPKSRTPKP